jgi:hypothetical protein
MTSTEEITGASEIERDFPKPDTDDPVRLYAWQMEKAWEGNRDQWGRPKVQFPDSNRSGGYKRASNFGAPLESDYLLIAWKLRQVLRGASRNKALQLEVTRAEHRLDDPNPEVVKDAKAALNELAQKAMDIVGSSDAAAIGTALHDILEHEDLGRDPGHVPEDFLPDVAAYKIASECFRTVSSERIVVEDKFKIGGRYDRCLEVLRPLETYTGFVIEPGWVIMGDVKTSQNMDFAGCKFGEQCWAYANGTPYDPITLERYGWAPAEDADDEAKALWASRYGIAHAPPRTDWAVIMHVPSGQGRARLYWVDLQHYGKAVKHTSVVYDWRNKFGKRGIRPVQSFEDYALTARYATTVDQLDAAYARAVDAEAWTPELRQIFGARKAQLQPPAVEDEQVPA